MLAQKKIVVLDDRSEQIGDLIKRLTQSRLQVRVCFTSEHLLQEIAGDEAHLLIVAGDSPEMTALQCAERAYASRGIPSFVIMDSAGERTQLRARKHPGILGMYYKPVRVQKMLERINKFLKEA